MKKILEIKDEQVKSSEKVRNTIYILTDNGLYSYVIEPSNWWEKFLKLIGQWN